MRNCNLLLLTAFITGCYDILLRYISENNLLQYDFVIALKPYFKKKTLLEGFLIAAFVGLVWQWIVLLIYGFPKSFIGLIGFFIVSFIIGGMLGIAMDKSNLFPDLSATQYKTLGRARSIITDSTSAIIVQTTVLFFYLLYNFYLKKFRL